MVPHFLENVQKQVPIPEWISMKKKLRQKSVLSPISSPFLHDKSILSKLQGCLIQVERKFEANIKN